MTIKKEDINNKEVYSYLLKLARGKNIFKTKLEEEDLANIKTIHLRNIQVEDFSFLRYLKNIEEINLTNITGIKDISQINKTKTLKSLYLWNTIICISSIDFENLTTFAFNITNEDLAHFKISDISIFSQMTNLKVLDISYNNIRNLSGLSDICPNIEELSIEENPIQSIEEIILLKHIKYLYVDTARRDELERLLNKETIEYITVGKIDDLTRTYFENKPKYKNKLFS